MIVYVMIALRHLGCGILSFTPFKKFEIHKNVLLFRYCREKRPTFEHDFLSCLVLLNEKNLWPSWIDCRKGLVTTGY